MSGIFDFELVGQLPVQALLGEGIVWDGRTDSFVWTDIEGRALWRCRWPDGAPERIDLPHRLGSFALTDSPDLIVAAFEQGFATFDLGSGAIGWIARPELPPGVRFNDGRVDRRGRFWAGTMVEDAAAAGSPDAGALYMLARRKAEPRVEGIAISNSLCWSPDGATMYFGDSVAGTIWRYAVDDLSRREVFARTERGVGPDGATIDSEGCLWSAQWGGSRIARYRPDGALAGTLSLPVSQPSCVAFGGGDLSLLAVTTARVELDDEALARERAAGDVLIYRTPFRGIPEERVLDKLSY